MAKRYRYAFAQRKPAKKGIFAAALAGVSVGLFLLAVLISFFCEGETVLAVGALIGGISIFAIFLSGYGFIQGWQSFSEENRSHTVSMVSAIANGIITVGWLALFLIGV